MQRQQGGADPRGAVMPWSSRTTCCSFSRRAGTALIAVSAAESSCANPTTGGACTSSISTRTGRGNPTRCSSSRRSWRWPTFTAVEIRGTDEGGELKKARTRRALSRTGKSYFLTALRRDAATPSRPRPSRATVVGSGTGTDAGGFGVSVGGVIVVPEK